MQDQMNSRCSKAHFSPVLVFRWSSKFLLGAIHLIHLSQVNIPNTFPDAYFVDSACSHGEKVPKWSLFSPDFPRINGVHHTGI